MKIGELSKVAHTPVETIRYYERKGLLPPPQRTAANYRVYTLGHVDRLSFVRHCRELGMSLKDIQTLLHFKDSPHDTCAEVNALLDTSLENVVARIRQLRGLQRQLRDLRNACVEVRAASQCGILNELAAAAREGRASTAQQARAAQGMGGAKRQT